MGNEQVNPHGERLRESLRWLSEHAPITRDKVDQAAVRFDLSPLEVDFLLREFLDQTG